MATDRNRSRAIVLCAIVALGLAAIAVPASAQAQKWMTPPLAEPTVEEPVPVLVKAEGKLSLLSKSGLSKIQFNCESLAIESGLLEVEGKDSGKALLAGCSTLLGGVVQKACVPSSPSTSEGSGEISFGFKGQLVMHEGTAYERIEPASGETFVEIRYPKGCSLTATKVTGSLYAQEVNGELEVGAAAHSFKEGTSGLGGLKYGTNPATVEGNVSVSITGMHAGEPWSGLGG